MYFDACKDVQGRLTRIIKRKAIRAFKDLHLHLKITLTFLCDISKKLIKNLFKNYYKFFYIVIQKVIQQVWRRT